MNKEVYVRRCLPDYGVSVWEYATTKYLHTNKATCIKNKGIAISLYGTIPIVCGTVEMKLITGIQNVKGVF